MTPNQVFWHRVWLIITALLLVAAYVNGFRISNAILSSDCRLATILTFVSSFCLVMGIKEYGKDFFNLADKLWYASFSGFIFIGFILLIFDSIFLALTTIIIDPSVKRALYPEQMQFLLPAFAILWIIILGRSFGSGTSSRQYYSYHDAPRKRSYEPPVVFKPPIKRIIRPNKTPVKNVRNKLHKEIGLLKRK
ncbi:hypothetical protein ACFL3Q_08835 [Planctomycetota bacterium]